MKFYKCSLCGNIVEKIHDSGVNMVCCGQPMEELKANTTDAALEKHVPDLSLAEGKLHVQVGSTAHPMMEEHYIMFIAAEAGDRVFRKELKPGKKPEADFCLGDYHGPVTVYEYCNLHGLWKAEITA